MTPSDGMHTLVLVGELSHASAHTLEAEIESLCEAGMSGITLDLRKLVSIDVTGARVVAFRSRLCKERGYEFVLIPGPRFIQDVFDLAGLTDLVLFQGETEPLGVTHS